MEFIDFIELHIKQASREVGIGGERNGECAPSPFLFSAPYPRVSIIGHPVFLVLYPLEL
jgi:hypothetical protein